MPGNNIIWINEEVNLIAGDMTNLHKTSAASQQPNPIRDKRDRDGGELKEIVPSAGTKILPIRANTIGPKSVEETCYISEIKRPWRTCLDV